MLHKLFTDLRTVHWYIVRFNC